MPINDDTTEQLMDEILSREIHSFNWTWLGGNHAQNTRHQWVGDRNYPFFVIVAPLDGQYEMRLADGRQYSITPGNALIVPPHIPHEVACESGCLLNYAHLFFRLAGWYDPFMFRDIPYCVTGENAERLSELVSVLARASESGTNIPSSPACSLITAAEIFELLFRISKKKVIFPVQSAHLEAIQRVILFLNKHYAEPLTRKELSRLGGLSETRFHYVFSEFTGYPPMDYLLRLRIEKARELLTITTLSVAEIAAKTGYRDVYFFSRQFRKKVGIPPVCFRRQQQVRMLFP